MKSQHNYKGWELSTKSVLMWAWKEGVKVEKWTQHEYRLEGKRLDASFFDNGGEAMCLALLDKKTGVELMYPRSFETLQFFLCSGE